MTGDGDPPLDAVVSAVRPMLSKHFKPALLARMNRHPLFQPQARRMKLITTLKLDRLKKTLQQEQQDALTYTPAVADTITARCTETETGARNIEYILNGNVLPQLSRTILSRMAVGEMPAKVHLDVTGDGSFALDFTRRMRGV